MRQIGGVMNQDQADKLTKKYGYETTMMGKEVAIPIDVADLSWSSFAIKDVQDKMSEILKIKVEYAINCGIVLFY